MKRAAGISTYSDSDPHTLVLAADHVGEHQAGIAGILREFGIQTSEATGIEERSMPRALADSSAVKLIETKRLEKFSEYRPKVRHWQKTSPVTILTLDRYHRIYEDQGPERLLGMVGPRWSDDAEAVAAWGEEGFIVVGYSDPMRMMLRTLYEAMLRGDFGTWTGNFTKNPFDPGGLVLTIPSRVPSELKTLMLTADQERNRLNAAAAATGIAARIQAANEAASPHPLSFPPFRYHALSPAWAEGFQVRDGHQIETSYPVVFFLNPGRQDTNNHGYYSVEELDAWLEGKGPVLKTQPEAEAPLTP